MKDVLVASALILGGYFVYKSFERSMVLRNLAPGPSRKITTVAPRLALPPSQDKNYQYMDGDR